MHDDNTKRVSKVVGIDNLCRPVAEARKQFSASSGV